MLMAHRDKNILLANILNIDFHQNQSQNSPVSVEISKDRRFIVAQGAEKILLFYILFRI